MGADKKYSELNNAIYSRLIDWLHIEFGYPIICLQPDVTFQNDLGMDPSEVFKVMVESEDLFDVDIDFNDFDFQPIDHNSPKSIRILTIQGFVSYLEKQIIKQHNFED